ncbi:hypothetical protein JGU66_20840 [Myxococcaceae bacterium JPH2]|nr:hypothetical protein [Myxococcaceae bacterium JPH2]
MVRAVSTLRRFVLALLVCSALTQTACLPFAQREGEYNITPTEVLRDDCELLRETQADLHLALQITGRVVRIDFGVQNMQLIGFFLEEGESFTADGSVANVSTNTNGLECLLDDVSVHMEGTTQCATQFDGVLRVIYQSNRLERCSCELWIRYQAVQDDKRCVPES